MVRVILADDDPQFIKDVTGALKGGEIEVSASTASLSDVYSRVKVLPLDAAVLGFTKMPVQYVLDAVRFLSQRMPVIAVAADPTRVRDLRSYGAAEAVLRPRAGESALRVFINELTGKLRTCAPAKAHAAIPAKPLWIPGRPFSTRFPGIIALGASVGGTEATANVLTQLPANIPPMIVTQHIPPMFSRIYAERLDNSCAMRVVEAQNEQPVMPGTVYIAPGDQHMKLIKKNGRYHVTCFSGPKVSGHCPSVDVMFDSVAACAGKDAVGIILTGMGRDGAAGLLKIRRNGCFTIGQDEATCVVYGMPKEAYMLGAVAHQDRLENIPGVLLSYLSKI